MTSLAHVKALACAVASAAALAATAGQKYQLTLLPTFGFESSACHFISESGMLLGYRWTNYGLPSLYYGFRFEDGVMTPFGGPPGYASAIPLDINSGGTAVGYCTPGYEAPFYPVVWDADGNATRITNAYAYGMGSAGAINDAGQFTLNFGGYTYNYRAFLMDRGRLTPILPQPGDVRATDVNESGFVCGYQGYPQSVAFVWKHGRVNYLLGADSSRAYGLNNIGWVVGERDDKPAIWANGALIEVPGPKNSTGYTFFVNDQSVVLGTWWLNGYAQHFMWSNGTVTHMDDLLPGHRGVLEFEPAMVNSKGQICGKARVPGGFFGGLYRGFVLTPVE